MPETFQNHEYADMVYLYGWADGNRVAARREYSRRYPNRRLPNERTFSASFRRLRETGSVALPLRGDGRFAALQNEERTNAILEHFDDNPTTSVRRSAAELNVARSTIWNTLKADGRHPFHLQKVQNLLPTDYPRRQEFCRWYLDKTSEEADFPERIIWTDEATFTRRGILNQRNYHIWADENPHAIREYNFQHEFQCNVWCGIMGNRLIGPFFCPNG